MATRTWVQDSRLILSRLVMVTWAAVTALLVIYASTTRELLTKLSYEVNELRQERQEQTELMGNIADEVFNLRYDIDKRLPLDAPR